MQQSIQKNKWWAITVLLLVVLNMGTLITFWYVRTNGNNDLGFMPPSKKDGAAAFLIQQLSLDSLQQQQFLFLKNEHQQGIRNIRKKLRIVKENFFDLLSDTTISENTVRAKSAEIAALEEQIEWITFQHFQQVRKMCTPLQQVKFDAIIKDVLKQIGPPPPPKRMRQGQHDDSGFEPDNHRPPPPPNNEHPFPPPSKENLRK